MKKPFAKEPPMTSPDIDLLVTDASPFSQQGGQGVAGSIRIEAPEFTHLDPVSNVAHLATVSILYIPREKIISAESFGHYLQSYRNFVGSPEDSIALLCQQIAEKIEPFQLKIETRWSPRAGVNISPSAQWVHPEIQAQAQAQQQQQPRIITPQMN